jgi:hypothetical protein
VSVRSVFTMPVGVVGRDRDGLPDRIRIPGGSSRRVPLVAGGETVGHVEPNGDVWVGDVTLLPSGSPAARMLTLMKHGDGRWRAVIYAGKAIAVVGTRR